MIHFKEYKNENGDHVLKYWFTSGISLNDINSLRDKINEICPKCSANPNNIKYHNQLEHFPTTKKFDNSVLITFVKGEITEEQTLEMINNLSSEK